VLEFSHNGWLILASFAVALMAAFTGLSLTRDASKVPEGKRKLIVVMAAVALGGGIWSMHFVAMLGLQLPIQFYYDALVTLISALLAILVVGLALLILHFYPRGAGSIIAAGVVVGFGIVLMHYVGMLGMRLCRPVNSVADYLLSGVVSIALSVFAIWVAYDRRTRRNILLGTVCFAMAVVAVHFVAVTGTQFAMSEAADVIGPVLSNQSLAIGVTVAVFLICGAFLLSGVSFLERAAVMAEPPESVPEPVEAATAGVPYQRDGHTQFVGRNQIAAIRAEGHYTLLYVGSEKLFCPWSISEADSRLAASGYVRTHRSYLVNPAHVSGFERLKDTGVVYFETVDSLSKVPVSRSRLAPVREALGL